MHLVKWIRKNNRKIMVFVVVFCMLAFVIGQFGIKLLVSLMGGGDQVIATYADNKKIKNSDYVRAQSELTILRMLMADQLLMAQSQNNITGPLLVHLLFPEAQLSSAVASDLKQAIQQGKLQLSQTQLDDFFRQQLQPPEILWLLLKAEAHRAGFMVTTEQAEFAYKQSIAYMIAVQTKDLDQQQILQYANQTFSRTVGKVMSDTNQTKEQTLHAYADLLSVMAYANNVMDSQTVTINQIKATLGRTKERIDAEFVKINAGPFVDENSDITDEQAQQQFETYKAVAPDNLTEDNPFGFGYLLPKRVQLEYMVVLIDDVEKQIEKPTTEAIEEYYTQNITKFQTQAPSDPNDPESEKITRTRPFAESVAEIQRNIKNEKTTTLANILFNEIKSITETGFETINFDEATADQLQMAAGDYVAAGKELAAKYHIPIMTGKTGWLDRNTFRQDKVLNTLGIRRGQQYLSLSDLAFTASEEQQARQRIDLPSVRVWQNIGPASGGFYSAEEKKYYRTMALVRVVGIQDSQVPGSVDVAFDTHGVTLKPESGEEEKTFSLKEKVTEDIRLIQAMKTAENRARELAAMVTNANWDDAITAYNEKYANVPDSNDLEKYADEIAQKIALDTIEQQLRMSQADVTQIKHMMRDNPGRAQMLKGYLVRNMLTNKLYALLPEDAEATGTIQTPLPFEPQAICYVVKEVIRKPATIKDYLENKAQTALQLSASESAGLAIVQFNPENILKRMDYKRKQQNQEPTDEQEAPLSNDDE